MAVLVSGASGFLGSRLVQQLAADGYEVIAVARRPPPSSLASSARVRWVIRDISRDGLDLKGLPDIEAVVHLAGATLGAGKDELNFLHANEQATVRLCQAVSDRTNRFVFASSQVVYGNACNLRVTEEFPLHPHGSAYACSKLNSENWLRWFQHRHGGQYVALRLCGFVDGGGIIDYLIDQALAGAPIELFSRGRVCRDYLPSSDGVGALIAAVRCHAAPGFLPINIGSEQSISAHDLARIVCREVGSSSKIVLSDTAAPQGDFVFSVERARQLLNFQPSALDAAIQRYARWRQAQQSMRVGDAKN